MTLGEKILRRHLSWIREPHTPLAGSYLAAAKAIDAAVDAAKTPKRFPVITGAGGRSGRYWIPWALAEEAYAVYSAKFGTDQSLKRLAERGGFGDTELDMFIPGWRKRCDAIAQARNSALEEAAKECNQPADDWCECAANIRALKREENSE